MLNRKIDARNARRKQRPAEFSALWIVELLSEMRATTSDSSVFPITRASLIVRLGSASRTARDRAWEEFFAIYAPVIFRMARHGGLDETGSEELVSTVMRNFSSAVRNGLVLRGRLRNYLRTITNRQIRRDLRLRPKHLSISEMPFEPATDTQNGVGTWEAIERQERWRACLDRIRESPAIRPRDWAAFEALVLRGEPTRTVARRYGVTPNRLYGIRHTVMNELRRLKLRLDVELGEV